MDDRPSGGRKAPVDRTRRTGRLVRPPPQCRPLTWGYSGALPAHLLVGAHRGHNSTAPGLVHRLAGPLLRDRPEVRVGVEGLGRGGVPEARLHGLHRMISSLTGLPWCGGRRRPGCGVAAYWVEDDPVEGGIGLP